MRRSVLACSILVLLIGGAMPTLSAQRTGAISGTVSDASGAVLPGADVTVSNPDTGQVRSLVSDDEGRYAAQALASGNYEVRAGLVGFQTAVRQGVSVQVGQEAVIDLSLSIGEISEEVIVTGEAPLINTTSATLSEVIDEKQVHELPLNNRNLVELALLTPGVSQARAASYAGETTSPGAVKISMGGARIYMTGYLLDGVDITDSSRSSGVGGAAGSLFGVETVREFNVITNNYSAQYSRFAGGVISLVTKSGTNDLRGSGFWFHRNDQLDAPNYFDRAGLQPEFKRHQFGATIGGPIATDKSFFFFSFEGFRENTGRSFTGFVPNASSRSGDIDGDGIAEVTVSPDAAPLLALYPLPNGADLGGGRAEFFGINDEPVNEDFITARWDHNFSDADSFFARYTFTQGDRGLGSAFPGDGWNSGSLATYVTLEEKHIFSPNLINTFKVGFQRTTYSQEPPQDDVCGGVCDPDSPLNIAAPGRGGEGFGQLVVSGGFSSFGTYLAGKNATNMFSYADDFFYTRGSHSMKFGANFNRYQNNDFFDGWPGGRYTFASLENFLIGNPREWRGKLPGTTSLRGAREWVIGFYLQDDIKVTPDFTLNIGVRYEFITTPTEVNGYAYTLGPDPLNAGQPTNDGPFFDNPSYNNIAPRIGLAWDPFGDGKTSVRAGYGIFNDTILFYQYANQMRRNCPINTTLFLFPRPGAPVGFPRPNTPTDVNLTSCRLGPTTSFQQMEFNVNDAYMQQWNLSIQRELVGGTTLSVAYIGSKGTHLGGHRNINNAEPTGTWGDDGTKFFHNGARPRVLPRRNPNYGDILLWDFSNDSNYAGLNASLRKRFADGLSFQVSYTWGKSVDTGSRFNNGDFSGPGLEPQDPYNVGGTNRGLSDHHVKHNFRFNYAYQLPVTGLSGAAGTLFQGWQLQGIVSFNSGGPLGIRLGGGGGLTDYNGDSVTGYERPNVAIGRHGNPVRADGRDPAQYYDPTAFVLHPKGTYGTTGRNTLIGPGVATVDFSMMKDTALSEDVNMQFRIEIFNLFNRANFGTRGIGLNIFNAASTTLDADGIPTTFRRNATAGRIVQTGTTSRQIQLGLRITF